MSLPTVVLRNGELIPPAQAHVSVFNPALSGSYGVYESLQVVRGRPFAYSAHAARLQQSAQILQFPLPADASTLRQWIDRVLEANQAADCTLRILAVGPENCGEATVFVWPQAAPIYPPSFYTAGCSTVTYAGHRAVPTAKSLDTLVCFLARRQAQLAGAHEALLYHDGCLTEGSNSNLFALVDGELLTAPEQDVLSGVSRDIVLQVARENAVPLYETSLSLAGMPGWSECLITSTSRHIMPVTVIDGRPVGAGRVGPLTSRLMALFEEYFAGRTAG